MITRSEEVVSFGMFDSGNSGVFGRGVLNQEAGALFSSCFSSASRCFFCSLSRFSSAATISDGLS